MTRKHLILGFFACAGFAASPALANNKGGDHMWKMMDSDGDGKISADEHAAAAKKMFEKMDVDNDGKVTAAEMDASHEAVTGKKAHKMDMPAAEKIKMVDTNGDGVLTAAEHEAGARKMFDEMDTNKDGYLSKAEFAAGHKKLLHKKEK